MSLSTLKVTAALSKCEEDNPGQFSSLRQRQSECERRSIIDYNPTITLDEFVCFVSARSLLPNFSCHRYANGLRDFYLEH
jgi:hypothetical protein